MHLTTIIPKEIQFHILELLEVENIVPCTRVCQLWHKFIFSQEFELEKKLAFHPTVIEITKSFPEEMITVLGGGWKVYCLPTLPIENSEFISDSINKNLTSPVMRGSNCTKFPFVVIALNFYENNKNEDNRIRNVGFNVFYRSNVFASHETFWASELTEYHQKQRGYFSSGEAINSKDYTFIKEIFKNKKLNRYGSWVKLKSEFPIEKSSLDSTCLIF